METEVTVSGTMEVDVNDLFGYMESDIQDCVDSMIRNQDVSDQVTEEAEELLSQYLNGASCSLAEKFTKAVGEAMSRLHADDTAATPGDEMETVIRSVVKQVLDEKDSVGTFEPEFKDTVLGEIRKMIREEIRALLYMGQSRLDVQAKYKRVDGYPWHAGGSDGQ